MILRYLVLKDFRQFYGEQRIEFADDTTKNVTIIFGHNGSGKTSLLNAFTWTLFDATTPAFENPREIANEQAFHELPSGGSMETWVRVCFEHNSRIYNVKKSQRATRDAGGQIVYGSPRHEITVQAPGQAEPETHENVTEIIGQILPRALFNFFFFDGERIEQIVKEEESRQLEGAVKTILGFEVLEKALKHLPLAKKIVRTNLERFMKGSVVEELSQRSTLLETDLALKREALDECRANRQALERQRETIDDSLRLHEASKERQALIDQLVSRSSELERMLVENSASVRRSLTREGFTAFVELLTSRASAIAEDLREKGSLPASFQQRFVQDLLNAGECICGTEIHLDGEARSRVIALLSRGGREDIEQILNTVSVYSGQYLVTRGRLRDDLARFAAERSSAEAELRAVRERISDERRKLGQLPEFDIASGVESRARIQSEIDDLGASLKLLSTEITSLEREHEELEKKISAAHVDGDKAKALQMQMDSVARIEKALKEILLLRRMRARDQLDERIKSTFASIAYKDYVPDLTESFALKLVKTVGGVRRGVAKSTGENQLLALSFVGALAALAKDRFEERGKGDTLSAYEGGIYPVVMDSPFGALDDSPRRDVAFAIPKLAAQVVVFCSKAQGFGVVSEQLQPHVGRTYVIVFSTSKPDVEQEFIELGGVHQQYTAYSADGFDKAQLQEVKSL